MNPADPAVAAAMRAAALAPRPRSVLRLDYIPLCAVRCGDGALVATADSVTLARPRGTHKMLRRVGPVSCAACAEFNGSAYVAAVSANSVTVVRVCGSTATVYSRRIALQPCADARISALGDGSLLLSFRRANAPILLKPHDDTLETAATGDVVGLCWPVGGCIFCINDDSIQLLDPSLRTVAACPNSYGAAGAAFLGPHIFIYSAQQILLFDPYAMRARPLLRVPGLRAAAVFRGQLYVNQDGRLSVVDAAGVGALADRSPIHSAYARLLPAIMARMPLLTGRGGARVVAELAREHAALGGLGPQEREELQRMAHDAVQEAQARLLGALGPEPPTSARQLFRARREWRVVVEDGVLFFEAPLLVRICDEGAEMMVID